MNKLDGPICEDYIISLPTKLNRQTDIQFIPIIYLHSFIYIYFFLQEGLVYAVEFSHRSGRDLINVAKKRTNIIPIIEDARHPLKYRYVTVYL